MPLKKWASECVEIVKARIEKYNIDCDLKWGYCEGGSERIATLKDYQAVGGGRASHRAS